MELSAVIIAGGKSSRMGRDKSLMPFGEFTTMVEFQHNKLSKIFDRVYLSSKSNKFPFKTEIIYDKYSDYNPLNAIISSLEYTDRDIFLLSVDMPLIDKNIINKLINYYKNDNKYDIYITKSPNGLEPTVAIYTKKILQKAKTMYKNSDYKLLNLIKSSNTKIVNFNTTDKFININYIEDYMALESCYEPNT